MAWYDNLQYPDYARHYENQGKIYSDLLNSLSKIGGEYLQKQREDKAGKDFEAAKGELRKQYTTPVPAVAEQLSSVGSPYIPAVEGYQPPPENRGGKYLDYPMGEVIMPSAAVDAIAGVPYRAAVPESTKFDQTGYNKGLLDLISSMYTGGGKEQKNLATEAITMYKLQDEQMKAGQPKWQTYNTEDTRVKVDSDGNIIETIEGVLKPKGEYFYDKNGKLPPLFIEYGGRQPVPEGYISKAQLQETGKERVAGLNIESREDIAKEGRQLREDIAKEGRVLQLQIAKMNNQTSITNKESGNIQSGINNLRNSLTSLINSLNNDRATAATYTNSEDKVALIDAEIDKYRNQINFLNTSEAERKSKENSKSKSGKGGTSGNTLNIDMTPPKR